MGAMLAMLMGAMTGVPPGGLGLAPTQRAVGDNAATTGAPMGATNATVAFMDATM
jgi:hypothetical protein